MFIFNVAYEYPLFIRSSVLAAGASLVLAGCTVKKNQGFDAPQDPNMPTVPETIEQTLTDYCGMNSIEIDDPAFKTLDKVFSGVPQVIRGKKVINYKIVATPEVKIIASNKQTTFTIKVSIVGDSVVAQYAGDSFAKTKVGAVTSTRLLSRDVATLARENQDFSEQYCGAIFETEIANSLGSESGVLRFFPAIPSSINSRGSLAMYRKEFAHPRSFSVVASIAKARTGWGSVGEQIRGTVGIKEVPSHLSIDNGDGFVREIAADVALEISTDFGGIDKTKALGLPIRQVYYIDTTKRDLVAILYDYRETNPSTGAALPETILLAK